jgi:hypothetical protein
MHIAMLPFGISVDMVVLVNYIQATCTTDSSCKGANFTSSYNCWLPILLALAIAAYSRCCSNIVISMDSVPPGRYNLCGELSGV